MSNDCHVVNIVGLAVYQYAYSNSAPVDIHIEPRPKTLSHDGVLHYRLQIPVPVAIAWLAGLKTSGRYERPRRRKPTGRADQDQVAAGVMKSNCDCRPWPTAFGERIGHAGFSIPMCSAHFRSNWLFRSDQRRGKSHGSSAKPALCWSQGRPDVGKTTDAATPRSSSWRTPAE